MFIALWHPAQFKVVFRVAILTLGWFTTRYFVARLSRTNNIPVLEDQITIRFGPLFLLVNNTIRTASVTGRIVIWPLRETDQKSH